MALVGAGMRGFWPLLAILMLAACAPWQPSPDRPRPAKNESEQQVVQAPPAWYRVDRGDTLYSIAFRYGLDWRDVARWNAIESPYTIRPGQELRMSAPPAPPPRQTASAESTSPPEESSGGERSQQPDPDPAPEPVSPEPAESRADPPAASASPAPAASGNTRNAGGMAWQWPTEGSIARAFDPAATRKGIGVAGSEGQDVRAAAAGQVVYSGTALIGYGELIIIKHSDKLLSAYGHNRRRLVGEGDRVQRGQKIAEMGRDDRQEEMLHFEIRHDGEPVNPLDYLPKR